MKNKFYYAALMLLALTSCKRYLPGGKEVVVYTAGYISLNGNITAAYWKNTRLVTLRGSYPAQATDIAVSDTNVYVSGFRTDANNNRVVVLWKNGVPADLSDSTVSATENGLALIGKDVYVCGNTIGPSGNPVATVWKNGVQTQLPDAGFGSNGACIATSGNDVYVGGEAETSDYSGHAVYWKNGVFTSIPLGNSGSGTAYGIAVDHGDVYLAGLTYGKIVNDVLPPSLATYWKNGVQIKLQVDTTVYSNANRIAVYNGNVLVTGNTTTATNPLIAAYLKNGAMSLLSDATHFSSAYGIVAYNNDVYIAGSDLDGYACYWKNGVAVPLSTAPSGVVGIAVVQRYNFN